MKKSMLVGQWQQIPNQPLEGVDVMVWEWLQEVGSLTERLTRQFKEGIQFRLVSAGWDSIDFEEQQALNLLSCDNHWLRKIEWCYKGELWIAARTVIPKGSLNHDLQQIGGQSIGNYLFQAEGYQRGSLEACCLATSDSGVFIWKRRSVFSSEKNRILVTETFFPNFFNSLGN